MEGLLPEVSALPGKQFKAFLESINPYNAYSQFGEDGILEAIFTRIGTANKWAVECGAANGVFFSNTRRLIEQGWSAVLIEASEDEFKKLGANCQQFIEYPKNGQRVVCAKCQIVPSGAFSFDTVLAKLEVPADLDLLVIDVDGQDYWLFNSLLKYHPRVVMVEYDPNAPAGLVPMIGGEGQAGLDSIIRLGVGKLYYPICATWCNVVFVRQDLAHLLADNPTELSQSVNGNAPPKDAYKWTKAASAPTGSMVAVMSTPRLGFLHNSDCIMASLVCEHWNIPLLRGEGVWWQHSLTRTIERALEAGAEYILTIDYDSAFTYRDIGKLRCFLDDNLHADVAVAVQMKREGGAALVTTNGDVDISQFGIPIVAGHFGLTLFRRNVFERLSKPWFYEQPDPNGSWNENRVDADMGFWRNCQEHSISVWMVLHAIIGHFEQVITWPGKDMKPLYQPMNDWRQNEQKPPTNVWQRPKAQAKAALDMGG